MGLRHLKRSPLYIVSVMALGVCLPLDAAAWGFGRAQTSAVLGVPLDFNVALRLDAGEAPPECLNVDVTVGDIPLARSSVSAVLDTSSATPLVRVRTLQAIDEPLVQVNLSAGCSSRVSRRFTLLADPPGHMAALARAPALANAEALTAATAATPAQTSAPAATDAAAAPTVATQPPAPAVATAPTAQTSAAAMPVARSASAVAPPAGAGSDPAGSVASTGPMASAAGAGQARPKAPAEPASKAVAPRTRTTDPTQLAEAKAAAPDNRAAVAPERPRLRLDAPTIATKGTAASPEAGRLAAVLAAEAAASAARAAASAAEARAAAMEKNIEALRQEAKANRESLARLTQALQDARPGTEIPIIMWGALAGLGALTVLLMWRLRRQNSAAGEAPWWSPGSAAATEASAPKEAAAGAGAAAQVPAGEDPLGAAPAEMPMSADQAPLSERRGEGGRTPAASPLISDRDGGGDAGMGLNPPPAARELPPLPDPEELDSPVGEGERTRLLPPSVSTVSAPIQGVSIEELLDLEQQVEFFTVLGQDDAALSLLVEHLRSTGGTYPLPYLKLLEIYRRKGDEDSYERTRDRFNQRFNAVAPAWGAPATADRHLEDLPDVLRRIEQVWPRPVDAMALLENMLVRTEGGTLLEMTALGEVLFLFTLARDLHEQEEGAAGPVDVLLPLGDLFDATPVSPPRAAALQATQFSSPLFDNPAPAVAVAGMAGAAGAAAHAAAAADDDADHFDLPLGEPMFEPVFDVPDNAVAPAGPASGPSSEAASIDLPLFSTSTSERPEDGGFGDGGFSSRMTGAEPQPPDLDLSFGTDSAPAASSPRPGSDPFLEPLSFDLPELEAIQAPLPSKAEAVGAVDLDISLDGLELEPVAPKLSAQEEQAAHNFGLFIDSPGAGKPR